MPILGILNSPSPKPHHKSVCVLHCRQLSGLNWDLREWRRREERRKGGPKPEVRDGLEVLDLDEGAGWELLCSLMAYKPADRWVAAAPWL